MSSVTNDKMPLRLEEGTIREPVIRTGGEP